MYAKHTQYTTSPTSAISSKVLLDFQLAGHRRFLASFVSLFREVDPDGRGTLQEASFRELLHRLDPGKDEAQVRAILATIDPHNWQQMTFSDCVATLSADLVRMLGDAPEETTDAPAVD
jgi:Ca2+-binding EF-hand superfamily protein